MAALSKILLFTLLGCLAAPVLAQNTEKDSLKTLLSTTKEATKRVRILENLSYAYLSAYPDSALQFAQQGLQLAQSIPYPRGEAYCLNALGSVYANTSDYSRALEMYFKSLEINERLNNQTGIAVTYSNIATVYSEQDNQRQALHYLFKNLQVDIARKDSLGWLINALNIGNVYERLNQTDSALFYERQAYQLAQRLHDENFIPAILNSFGAIYASSKEYPTAIAYHHQAILAARKINDQQVLSDSYYGLAKISRQTGALDSAVFYGRNAFVSAREASFRKQMLDASRLLTDLFADTQRFDSAFHYQRLSGQINDSLFSAEKVRQVQNLVFLEQQRQQSLQAARAEYNNQVRLYVLVSVLAALSLIGMILWRNNRQKQQANTLLQQQKDQIQQQKNKVEQALTDLRLMQIQLIQQEKMASLGELTAGIAHEIQNPLNFVNNFAEVSSELVAELNAEVDKELLDKDYLKGITTDLTGNLSKIHHHGQRADAIVKGMLEHARTSTGERQLIDLNALTEEYLRLSYHGLRAKDQDFNASLVTAFDESLGKVEVVPQEIGRVLLNLFNNAFYATQQQKAQLDGQYQPQVRVSTKQTGGKVTITVADNGVGIPENVRQKIFQPFFTTKPTGQGTGLGLSLSYDIITKGHGGELKVESQPGQGAEFTVVLPIQP